LITSVKLCVDIAGQVSEARLLRSSNYPGYDRKILAEIGTWEFSPIEVDGSPRLQRPRSIAGDASAPGGTRRTACA
jgi:TonB family protein